MPTTTTPSRNSVSDALRLSALLRPTWDETAARIPSWHPRNEVDPAAAAAAPEIDWESDDNPFKKRYTDTQSEYTRGQQELARLRALEEDPSAYLELGKTKGWVEFDDPQQQQEQDPYAERFAALEARQAEHDARIAAENAAAGEELFHADLDTWADAEGVKLSKADHNAIFGLLMKAPDPTQESAARQIFEAHVADKKAEREAIEAEIREQMRRPRVPHVPSAGQTGTHQRVWSEMTEDEQAAEMAEMVRARSA